MIKLTIIVEETRGIFLGVFNGIALFVENDIFDNSKAIGFNNQKEAKEFVEKYLPEVKDSVEYIDIPSSDYDNYVDLIDIIKAGYTQHTMKMLENLPTETTIH